MSNTDEYDLIVIGAGPAGTPTAFEYATMHPNAKVLLVDSLGKLGGECLFEGCIPSKILEIAGNHYKSFETLKDFGIEAPKEVPKLIWEKIVKNKESILTQRTHAALDKLNAIGNITLIKGDASFVDKSSIKIREEENEKLYSFKKALIATGTRTSIPMYKGNGIDKVWTNNEFFRYMKYPKSITIVGDGPIGIEFTQILATLDVEVNIIGRKDYILSMLDKEFSNVILEKIRTTPNINLILSATLEEINFSEEERFTLKYTQDTKSFTLNSEYVFMATGRVPNIENLNLDSANVAYDKKGIKVDPYLQTSNSNIYAAGDVILGAPQFAHTASYEAHIVAQNLFFNRNKFKVDFNKNSWVLFSEPNIVSAGLTETEAKRVGYSVVSGTYDFAIDAKTQIEGEAEGFMKYIVDKKTLTILGVHIIQKNASAFAGSAALIVSNKLTLPNLVDSINPHPTYSESFTFLAKMMMGDIMQERMKSPLFKVGFFMKKWFL